LIVITLIFNITFNYEIFTEAQKKGIL